MYIVSGPFLTLNPADRDAIILVGLLREAIAPYVIPEDHIGQFTSQSRQFQ